MAVLYVYMVLSTKISRRMATLYVYSTYWYYIYIYIYIYICTYIYTIYNIEELWLRMSMV